MREIPRWAAEGPIRDPTRSHALHTGVFEQESAIHFCPRSSACNPMSHMNSVRHPLSSKGVPVMVRKDVPSATRISRHSAKEPHGPRVANYSCPPQQRKAAPAPIVRAESELA